MKIDASTNACKNHDMAQGPRGARFRSEPGGQLKASVVNPLIHAQLNRTNYQKKVVLPGKHVLKPEPCHVAQCQELVCQSLNQCQT